MLITHLIEVVQQSEDGTRSRMFAGIRDKQPLEWVSIYPADGSASIISVSNFSPCIEIEAEFLNSDIRVNSGPTSFGN